MHSNAINELMRAIRSHVDSLLGEHKTELNAMNLALAHSLGRYKVKFNPEKIDTMIVQVINSSLAIVPTGRSSPSHI